MNGKPWTYARSTNKQKTESVLPVVQEVGRLHVLRSASGVTTIFPNELEIYDRRGSIKVGRRLRHLS